MTPEVLRNLWQLMRSQRQRFDFEADYGFICDLTDAVDGLEIRLDRYSIDVKFFEPRPVDNIADGLLGLYCWMQAAAMQIKAEAERGGLTNGKDRDCL